MVDVLGNEYVPTPAGWRLAPELERGRPAVFDFGLVAAGESRTVEYQPMRVQRFGGPALEVWHHGPLRHFTVTEIVFGYEIWNRQPLPAVMLRAMWQAARGPALSVHVPLRITVRNDDRRPHRLVLALEPLELR